ncbi:unnamed protein product [Closterium sp. Naga37s-1]|nr:unnamed protein product [Closterium sp. Naga37s-1]
MTSEELQRREEEEDRRRADADGAAAAKAATHGWGTGTTTWGAGSSTPAGTCGTPTVEEEEPIEEVIAHVEREPEEAAAGPYSRYPHSPLPTESTPIGPHDPTTADPSTIQGLPPHHVQRPNLTEGTADTDDTTAPLAALTTVSPDP